MNIIFNNIPAYAKGLIENLLLQSYQYIPTTTAKDMQNFKQFDSDILEHPQWIGTFVFITTIDHEPIGFVSFDPRQKPTAVIRHNCIVPSYTGKRFGKRQMKYALLEIKKQGFENATVSTCNNNYFIPAQRMYTACGFHVTNKFYKEDNGIEIIGYELNLE